MALFESGRWGPALETIQNALTVAEKHKLHMVGTCLLVRGIILRSLLLPEKALADHERARRLVEATPNPHMAKVPSVDLCADHAATGRWSDAYRYARETRDTEAWAWLFGPFSHWRVVETNLHQGNEEQARAAAAHFEDRIGDNVRYAIPRHRSLAQLAERDGRPDETAEHLRQAAAVARRLDLPGELWSLQRALWRLYDALDQPDEARAAHTEAERLAQQLAATLPGDERTAFLTRAEIDF